MGCVYVLSNPSMPGLMKIGFTMRDAVARATELSSSSGVPQPFRIEYYHEDEVPSMLEFSVHEVLGVFRLNADREFFRVSAEKAISTIQRVAASQTHWRRSLFTVWNRGAQDWRERALEAMDRPVFDRS